MKIKMETLAGRMVFLQTTFSQFFVRYLSRQSRLALGLFGGGLLCSTLVIATSPEHSPEALTDKSWSVTAMNYETQSLSPNLTLYGNVSRPRKTKLAAAVTTNVDWVLVEEGQAVEKGDLLIQLDDREATLEVRLARASFNDSLAQLAELEAQYIAETSVLQHPQERSSLDDARSLARQQVIALEQQGLLVANYKQTKAKVEAAIEQAEARLGQARLTLSRTKVVAPFNGLVSGLAVAPGDRVSAGHLLTGLIDSRKVEARAIIASQ